MTVTNGQSIKQETLDSYFLTGPSEFLIDKVLMQMAQYAGFVKLFGPYKPRNEQQRWADYQRFDWSIRQLPAINVFESQSEEKSSDQAWLNGTVSFQVFWPASLRRGDSRRDEVAFKGAMQNFFSSIFVQSMMDELYYIERPEKVPGLNEFGKYMTWIPNSQGLVEEQLVPVTIMEVKYRIDLRSWYRYLEFMGRTKNNPAEITLSPLTDIAGEYDGTPNKQGTDIQIKIFDEIPVSN